MHPINTFFERCLFIMSQPSHPGNVGAAARALKTMGFARLALAGARFPDMTTQANAVAMASRATDVLDNALMVPDLTEALAPATLSFALTARPRDIGPQVSDIRQAAQLGVQHLQAHNNNQIAIVLGTERTGLNNEDISRCRYICHIPANPEYSSLNVAQALQLAAWELRYAILDASENGINLKASDHPLSDGDQPASQAELEALFTHWQEALETIQFLDPNNPKKLMLKMRHWLTRSELSKDETNMLRGVCTEMIRSSRSNQHD